VSTNLAFALDSFVGRTRELAQVAKLLGEARLVTLTGAPGIGKTRLALEVASGVGETYPDGTATVVEVQTLGADGTKLTTTYSGILGLDPSDAVSLGSGGAASSVFTSRPPFRPIGGQLDPLTAPDRTVARGLGGGTVDVGGAATLRLSTDPWQLRTV